MKENKDKKHGFFSAGDLIVYAVLLALVGLLFVLFVFGGQKSEGFAVDVAGERVYTYLFGTGGKIASGKETLVFEETEGDSVIVTVYTDETKKEYNVVVIDTKQKTAIVSEANCSLKKDCTHMPEVTLSRGAIVCVPHALTVKAVGGEEDFSPSVG